MIDPSIKQVKSKILKAIKIIGKNKDILNQLRKEFDVNIFTNKVRDAAKTALIKAGRDPDKKLFMAMISSFKVIEDYEEGFKLLIKEDWENETIQVNQWERKDGGIGETYIDTDMLYHIFDKGRKAYTIRPRGDNESQLLAIPPDGGPYDYTNEDNTIIQFGNVPAMEGAEFTDAATDIYDGIYSDFITAMQVVQDDFIKLASLIDEITFDIMQLRKDGLI